MNIRPARRLVAFAASLGIVASALTGGLSASAAPTETVIRLVTPIITADNAYQNYDDPGYWVSQGWFPAGITYRTMYAPVGSTINLTYFVTDAATKQPLADTTVMLRVNKGYSISNAKVKIGDSAVTTGIERTGIDQLRVTGKTDQFGYVSFKLIDMDDPKDGAEPQPTAFNVKAKSSAENPMGDPNIALFTQIKPEILGEKNDQADFVDFHFYKPNADANPDMSASTVSVIAPLFDSTNSVTAGDVQQKYAEVGHPFVLAYNVKDAKGANLANKEVKVAVTGGAKIANSGAWTGTTDAYGNVVFNVTNADTKGEAKPASATAAVPASGVVFGQLNPAVTGSAKTTAATVQFHFWGGAATPTPTAKKKTITCIKGKLVKKVTALKPKCPAGYKLKKK